MYKIQQGSEEINSNGGISLIGALLSKMMTDFFISVIAILQK
ncbi:MAG: hypothetical protein WCI51_14150 [Lentisphaerota bacterium]